MKLTFWGAVGTVTGSMHEVGVNGSRFLLDCGIYQGRRKEARERNSHLPFEANSIDAVVLSHAHLDHSGNLPTLVKNGFGGPIYATPSTVDLCAAMLRDSAHIQEKDALFIAKRTERRRSLKMPVDGEPVEPLYTMQDAEDTLPLFKAVPLHTLTEVAPTLSFETYDAGHILGSTCVLLHNRENGREVKLLFSGDIGRRNLPIIRDPDEMPPVDYAIMESTYGDRLHKEVEAVAAKLAEVVNRTCARGGRVIVPAFAVGRAQQLVLLLHELINAEKIPNIPIFVDSPLTLDVTEIFRKHSEEWDAETRDFLLHGEDPFGFKRLRYIRDVGESKALNDLRGPFIVISASGMCEAGRILHHLRNNIENPRNTILITGFQAEHTLGRKLVDKWPEVAIFGEPMRVRAEVVKMNELSAHADQRELLGWLKPMAKTLKKVFLVHGEPSQTAALAKAIQAQYAIEVVIPTRGETFDLS
jgi:metallo-beta-lactamase family protein